MSIELLGLNCFLEDDHHNGTDDKRSGESSVVRAPDTSSKKSRVRVPAEAAEEFSSQGSTF